jgi:glycerol-3-phosphate dehydrogenase
VHDRTIHIEPEFFRMKRDVTQLENGPFDLLVVGGGIYGAWTAYDAALRGLKVAIIDKRDWAAGTSSATSKLLHGGLRYLEYLRFGLVKKSLRERELLSNLAPHRAIPTRFLIPVYGDSRVHPIRLRAGLWLYHILAGGQRQAASHAFFSGKEILSGYPFLKKGGLRCGYTYRDCQMDDFRMTLEVVYGATQAGAAAVNYAEANELLMSKGRIVGARVRDRLGHRTIDVLASAVVNAAGPWAPRLRAASAGVSELRMTKGVHVTLPPLPTQDALLIMTREERRVVFLIPWYGRTLLGTTDTDFQGNPDTARVEERDVDYLLTEVNHVLGEGYWDSSSICCSYAGVRALQNIPGKSPSAVTRGWQLERPFEGLWVSIGGKFTSARTDSADIVDSILRFLDRPGAGHSPTETRRFPWCPEGDFSQWKNRLTQEGLRLGLDEETAASCCLRYGTSVEQVHTLLRNRPSLAVRIVPDLAFCKAEILQGVTYEMAVTLEDVLRRRIPLLILARVGRQLLDEAADMVSSVLDWSAERRRMELDRVLGEWNISD